MTDEWFCVLNGKECGPFAVALLQKLADQGKLSAEDWVRKDSKSRWIGAREIGVRFKSPQRPTPQSSLEAHKFVPAPFTPVELPLDYREPRLLISGVLVSAFLLSAGIAGILREFGMADAATAFTALGGFAAVVGLGFLIGGLPIYIDRKAPVKPRPKLRVAAWVLFAISILVFCTPIFILGIFSVRQAADRDARMAVTHEVSSNDGKLQFRVPAGWETWNENVPQGADLALLEPDYGMFFVVFKERKPASRIGAISLGAYAARIEKLLKKTLPDIAMPSCHAANVDGNDGLAFELHGKDEDGTELAISETVIELQDRYVQVRLWSSEAAYSLCAPEFAAIAKSCRFK